MNIFSRVKNSCQEQLITIERLEKECNLPPNSVVNWNKSLPSGDKILRVAKYLDISIDYLVNGKENSGVTCLVNLTDDQESLIKEMITEFKNSGEL